MCKDEVDRVGMKKRHNALFENKQASPSIHLDFEAKNLCKIFGSS